MPSRSRLPVVLLGSYAFVWVLCAINPLYPSDWLLENMLIFVFVPVVIVQYRRGPVSDFAYGCLFVFFCLHTLGSHYTYAEVPYDRWWEALTGHTFNSLFGWERNHYDRLVHFLYGLLCTPIWAELIWRANPGIQRFWRWLIPMTFMMAHSLIYELIEWGAAVLFGGDLGAAYLGLQGDVWDAQQDMLQASMGTVVILAYLAWRGRLGKA